MPMARSTPAQKPRGLASSTSTSVGFMGAFYTCRRVSRPSGCGAAILYENNPMPLLLLSITVFLVRILFIRTKNTVGARSAQEHRLHRSNRVRRVLHGRRPVRADRRLRTDEKPS